MRRIESLAAFGLLIAVTGVAGCDHGLLRGDGRVYSKRFTGDVGVCGNRMSVTLQPGSRVWKLHILGDQNHVCVEDGAAVRRIAFSGARNEIFLPTASDLAVQEWGDPSNTIFVRDTGQPLEPPPVRQPASQTARSPSSGVSPDAAAHADSPGD